jgi:hypothetical protein
VADHDERAAGKAIMAPATEADVRIAGPTADKARLCIQAAELRARHKSFTEIAATLNLASPMVAKRAVQEGLTLIPAEDVREVRRLSDQRLDRMARDLIDVVDNPGPLVSQGKIMLNEENLDAPAVPYPDQMVRVRALEALIKLDAEYRKLHGADAPRRSVTITSEMIAARVAELKNQLGLQGASAALEWLNGATEPGGAG